MTDKEIIAGLWERDEHALDAFDGRYRALIRSIALDVLGSEQDADECLNDVRLAVWNRIPPERPASLKAYVGTLARNIAVDRLRQQTAQKRRGTPAALDELAECLPDPASEVESDDGEIEAALNAFLTALSREDRVMFVRRYWFGDTPAQIAARVRCPAGTVRVRIYRLRQQLKTYLEERGITL